MTPNQPALLTWYYANSGTGHPATLVEVSLYSEDCQAIEQGEDEQESGVDVEQEESLLRDVTLGVAQGHLWEEEG